MYTQDTPLAISNPASVKQIDFIRSMVIRKYAGEEQAKYLEFLDAGTISKKRASEIITHLMGLADITPEMEVGVYVVDAKIYKVYKTRNGFLATKTLTEDEGFVYTGRNPLRFIKASDRMTKEAAAEYGALYGVCVNCQALLTDEKSIAQGYGPVCAQYFA